jgi:hypothetical protein
MQHNTALNGGIWSHEHSHEFCITNFVIDHLTADDAIKLFIQGLC